MDHHGPLCQTPDIGPKGNVTRASNSADHISRSPRPASISIRAKAYRPIRTMTITTSRWLDELMTDPKANTESIASREGCSVRKINMTISLAFLAPDLAKAAIDGRLPYGLGVARLCDLPTEWPRQRQMLGLAAR